MSVAEAKSVFAELMAVARRRSLTAAERAGLRRASQVIRYFKRVKNNSQKKALLSRRKARRILHEGVAGRRLLTARQRRFFGARASGYPRRPAARSNRAAGVVAIGRALEVRYQRTGRRAGYYKHDIRSRANVFTVPPGWIYLPKKSIVIASEVRR